VAGWIVVAGAALITISCVPIFMAIRRRRYRSQRLTMTGLAGRMPQPGGNYGQERRHNCPIPLVPTSPAARRRRPACCRADPRRGAVTAAAALKALPASCRHPLAPELQALGNSTVSFHEWVDDQHHLRNMTEVETVNGDTVNTTINVTAINQPVHITLPHASQTFALQGSSPVSGNAFNGNLGAKVVPAPSGFAPSQAAGMSAFQPDSGRRESCRQPPFRPRLRRHLRQQQRQDGGVPLPVRRPCGRERLQGELFVCRTGQAGS
jgi:hypothetical protein